MCLANEAGLLVTPPAQPVSRSPGGSFPNFAGQDMGREGKKSPQKGCARPLGMVPVCCPAGQLMLMACGNSAGLSVCLLFAGVILVCRDGLKSRLKARTAGGTGRKEITDETLLICLNAMKLLSLN